jgi:hypothetical protein
LDDTGIGQKPELEKEISSVTLWHIAYDPVYFLSASNEPVCKATATRDVLENLQRGVGDKREEE